MIRLADIIQRCAFTDRQRKGRCGIDQRRRDHDWIGAHDVCKDAAVDHIAIERIIERRHRLRGNGRKGIDQLNFVDRTMTSAVTRQQATEVIGATGIGGCRIA